MKDKIKKLFGKKKDEEPIFMNNEEEIEFLRKENEKLKKPFSEQAIAKMKTRRSIRRYSDKVIDFEIVYSIIEAGLNAPCAGNMQNYKVIVLEDKSKMQELAKVSLQQYWMSDAPMYLVVVRDDSEVHNNYPEYGEEYSIQNVSAMISSMLNAAHFYDLGACWVECGDNGVLRGILEVPEEMHVDAIIPIGYPMEQPSVDKVPTKNFIFFEKWGEKNR